MTKTCPPDHRHGTAWTCYKAHGCRCDSCRAWNSAKVADWRTRNVTGNVDKWVRDTATVREHVMFLRSLGMTVNQIADRAGVGVKSIGFICNGRSRQVAGFVYDALMGVRYEPKPATDYDPVDATGTRRRLQALTRQGWPGSELMARLGKDTSYSTFLFTTDRVQLRTAKDVAALYDELWDQTPPDTTASKRARLRAERKGWVSSLAWDDETIDDPAAAPATAEPEADHVDDVKVEHALRGEKHPLNYAEKRAAVTIAHTRRWSDMLIAHRIGIAQDTVMRIRAELGLPAWSHEDAITRSEAA